MWASAPKLDAYIAPLGPERNPAALTLARELRRAGLSVEVGDGSFRLKKSFEAADRTARHIVLLGEDEVATNTLTVKTFSTGEQWKSPVKEIAQVLRADRFARGYREHAMKTELLSDDFLADRREETATEERKDAEDEAERLLRKRPKGE
jgi:hypothetical protein